MSEKPVWTGIRRGTGLRCPACGEGRLFGRFLKVCGQCPVCLADNTIYPSDDMPPYVTMLLVGHLLIPLFMIIDRVYAPATWLQFTIWPLLATVLCIALLQPVKGGVIGLCWAVDLHRQR